MQAIQEFESITNKINSKKSGIINDQEKENKDCIENDQSILDSVHQQEIQQTQLLKEQTTAMYTIYNFIFECRTLTIIDNQLESLTEQLQNLIIDNEQSQKNDMSAIDADYQIKIHQQQLTTQYIAREEEIKQSQTCEGDSAQFRSLIIINPEEKKSQAIKRDTESDNKFVESQEENDIKQKEKKCQGENIQAFNRDSQQDLIIKGTQRKDGTWRKDTKIRAGYYNSEMIDKYIIPQKRLNKK